MLNNNILQFMKQHKYVNIYFTDENVYVFYDPSNTIPLRFIITDWYEEPKFLGGFLHLEKNIYNEKDSLKFIKKFIDMKIFF